MAEETSDGPKVKPYNAGDAQQVDAARSREKRRRERELNDVRAILATAPGRRWYWRILTQAGIFTTSFTGNSSTFFKEGMRNMGLQMLGDLNEACPDRYEQMVREDREAQAREGLTDG